MTKPSADPTANVVLIPSLTMLSAALLLRTALVLATSWSLHVTCTPPHPSPPPSAQSEPPDADVQERLFVRGALAVKTLLWLAALSELRLAFTRPDAAASGIDAVMLLGCAAAVLGGWTRARCYALLGARFTFELAAHGARQPELVSTGPYALVRHPSYSAACAAFYGACAVFLSPKSAIRLSGGPGWVVTALIGFLLLAPLHTLPRRVAREEEMLAKEFGERWLAYAARVRYRMIPGVY